MSRPDQPRHGAQATPRTAAGMLLLGLAAPTALALCMDGRAPTVAHESAQAVAVVETRVTRSQDLHEDATDPDGITATRHTVRVLRTLRGHAAPALTLHSENTSARFPMETGERYLLFLSRDRAGRYFIDACGNSARLSESQATVKALAARRGKGTP